MRKITLFVASLLFSIGAWAQTGFSVTDTKYTSAELNALTKPTLIAIKNLSATNHYYFVGKTDAAPYSKAEFSKDAVFVWEPVAGETGKFYLKKLDGTYMQTSSPKDFGTVDNAVKFTTTNPTSKGSGATKFNGDGDSQSYINGNDDTNLVRFVKGSDWINVQNGDAGTPTYNAGLGGWTIHYVYAVAHKESTPWDFTFTRTNTSEAIVSVTNGSEAVNGVTATIAIDGSYQEKNQTASNKGILCIDRNTVDASASNPNAYTLTITNNSDLEYTFDYVAVEGVAVNSGGEFQTASAPRDRMFQITCGTTAIEAKKVSINDAQHCNGKETFHAFAAPMTIPAGESYTITVNIYNDTNIIAEEQAKGCFYGLTKIAVGNNTTVSFGTTGYATLYAPIALTIPEGVTAYTGTLNEDNTWLTLSAIEDGIIPKKHAVILEGTDEHTLQATIDAGTIVANNALRGTLSALATSTVNVDNNEAYTLQPNGEDGVVFKRFDGDYLSGGKAYLMLSKSSAQSIGVRFEDGTTDIEHSTLNPEPSTQIYDLMGRRVEAMTKGGIYIVNGKKVVIK